MNKIIISGRLTKDPEQRKTQSNKSVTNFTVAVNRRSKDEPTDFVNCIAWEKRSDFIQQYLEKGNRVNVAGRMESRTYDKSDGQKVQVWELQVEDIEPVDWREKTVISTKVIDTPKTELDIDSSDLPF